MLIKRNKVPRTEDLNLKKVQKYTFRQVLTKNARIKWYYENARATVRL